MALGLPRGPVQFDFIDLGLLPAIEQEVQRKLDRAMAEVLTANWQQEDVAAVLDGIQRYYDLGLLGTDVAAVAADDIAAAWARLR